MLVSEKEKTTLEKIYYQSDPHMWSGRKAIKLLQAESKLSRKKVIDYLSRQAQWQCHLRPPRKIKRAHYNITVPNEVHQFDIEYMPHDTLYGTEYKYILTGIDIASRYKVARPLATKTAKEVLERLTDIYKKGPLKWPKTVQVDNGSEFKAVVKKAFKLHDSKKALETDLFRWHHKKKYQKDLKEEVLPVAWHPSRFWNWCMAEDEKKTAEQLWK